MIRYQLQCQGGHVFEAWFSNSAAFDAQAAQSAIACPHCGSSDVSKAIMSPNLSPSAKRKGQESPVVAEPEEPSLKSAGETSLNVVADSFAMQREFTEVMRKMRAEVESKAEYVGPRFAEEARNIHDETSEPRGIYGEATAEEVSELHEDGVEFFPLPRLPEDNN